jgi:hypothetical protein
MKALLFISLIMLMCCNANHKVTQESNPPVASDSALQLIPGPPALVYKTKADYHLLVPVLLSEDKSEIISYPHPSDMKIGDSHPYPTELNNGYLLDNRGIGMNVGFLSMTYEEYSKLESAPSLAEMYGMLIDKDPLLELCDCGNKNAYTDITSQLNKLIDEGKLRTDCKPLK